MTSFQVFLVQNECLNLNQRLKVPKKAVELEKVGMNCKSRSGAIKWYATFAPSVLISTRTGGGSENHADWRGGI